ncbi:MAG TPA: DNA methyltransferase, partial [Phycisphaerae bacterium]|nr:DNA methyltransferase [Phycisphaerae bacterium]
MPIDEIICGDCLEVMRGWPDASVDAIVTDPPYALTPNKKSGTQTTTGGFMGKKWDNGSRSFSVEFWAEALRLLKPGGHLLSFGGTRTYHRMAIAIEDAGFEIRDMIQWLYGSGFPKSLNISKAIDKAAGAQRKVVGRRTDRAATPKLDIRGGKLVGDNRPQIDLSAITAPATDDAKRWDGWGTALKPACEPVCVARKPLEGTVADNVLIHGTGGLNIEAGRIGTDDTRRIDERPGAQLGKFGKADIYGSAAGASETGSRSGRWPANVALDEEAAALLDEQSGELVTGGSPEYSGTRTSAAGQFGLTGGQESWYDRAGGA